MGAVPGLTVTVLFSLDGKGWDGEIAMTNVVVLVLVFVSYWVGV